MTIGHTEFRTKKKNKLQPIKAIFFKKISTSNSPLFAEQDYSFILSVKMGGSGKIVLQFIQCISQPVTALPPQAFQTKPFEPVNLI